jgi:hypothetical protein
MRNATETNPMMRLPPEARLHVYGQLDKRSAYQVGRASKGIQVEVEDNQVWRDILGERPTLDERDRSRIDEQRVLGLRERQLQKRAAVDRLKFKNGGEISALDMIKVPLEVGREAGIMMGMASAALHLTLATVVGAAACGALVVQPRKTVSNLARAFANSDIKKTESNILELQKLEETIVSRMSSASLSAVDRKARKDPGRFKTAGDDVERT